MKNQKQKNKIKNITRKSLKDLKTKKSNRLRMGIKILTLKNIF